MVYQLVTVSQYESMRPIKGSIPGTCSRSDGARKKSELKDEARDPNLRLRLTRLSVHGATARRAPALVT